MYRLQRAYTKGHQRIHHAAMEPLLVRNTSGPCMQAVDTGESAFMSVVDEREPTMFIRHLGLGGISLMSVTSHSRIVHPCYVLVSK